MAKAFVQAYGCEIRLLQAYKTITGLLLHNARDDGPILVLMAELHIPQQNHETSAHNACSCSHIEAACHGAHENSWLNMIF